MITILDVLVAAGVLLSGVNALLLVCSFWAKRDEWSNQTIKRALTGSAISMAILLWVVASFFDALRSPGVGFLSPAQWDALVFHPAAMVTCALVGVAFREGLRLQFFRQGVRPRGLSKPVSDRPAQRRSDSG